MIAGKHDERDLSVLVVLLLVNILIGCHQYVEAGLFRDSDQAAIGDASPAHLLCSHYQVGMQSETQFFRGVLVEEYLRRQMPP
jgi:hypothetical protein